MHVWPISVSFKAIPIRMMMVILLVLRLSGFIGLVIIGIGVGIGMWLKKGDRK